MRPRRHTLLVPRGAGFGGHARPAGRGGVLRRQAGRPGGVVVRRVDLPGDDALLCLGERPAKTPPPPRVALPLRSLTLWDVVLREWFWGVTAQMEI